MNEVLLDKIRKLLAKAEGTDNTNEAEAFSAKAAQLIAEHRIDPDHVRDALDARTPRAAPHRPRPRRLRARPPGAARRRRPRPRLRGRLRDRSAGYDGDRRRLRGRPRRHRGAVHVVARPGGEPDGRRPRSHPGSDAALAAIVPVRVRQPRRRGARRRREPTPRPSGRRDRRTSADRTDRSPTCSPGRPGSVRSPPASFGRVGAARAAAPAQRSAWRDGHRAAGDVDLGRTRLAGRPAVEPREAMTVIDRGQAAVAAAEETAFGGTDARRADQPPRAPSGRIVARSRLARGGGRAARLSPSRRRVTGPARRAPRPTWTVVEIRLSRRAADARHRRPRAGPRPRRRRSGPRCRVPRRLRRRGRRARWRIGAQTRSPTRSTAMGVDVGERRWPAPYRAARRRFVVTSAGSVSMSGGSSPSTLTATPMRRSR